jgi:hypothetical protein
MSAYAYNQIFNKIQQDLTPEEQIKLLADLAALVRDREVMPRPQRSLLELRGLGKELWSSIDVDQYLEEERNSWDG